ncbi:MAG: hypothetical protein WA705_22405 [Candidatus Ozemobacteraceae bacterium]
MPKKHKELPTFGKAVHSWAAGGVAGYPLTHPIVGQSGFFRAFKQFIHLVEHQQEKFIQVFAVVAQWGVGKSRLGYELIGQINDSSRGWYVRTPDGHLEQSSLFHDHADREKYLGLYIRYSQIVNPYQNTDNWYGFGLYKALLPLARGEFDASIQETVARESYDQLFAKGFDPAKMAQALELEKNHSDEALYEDPHLVTRLCESAFAYIKTFGIGFILIVLDELETAAEASTFGIEGNEMKYLDGQAIKLIGKAIKEEDVRHKLPWLRYVALCSPAIGEELREIPSTARRFDLIDLENNSFADVSDFVGLLNRDGRMAETYPIGLVESAYAMSGGNFGWFNVIMAQIDQVLKNVRTRNQSGRKACEELLLPGMLFHELVGIPGRVREHVLDHHALDQLTIGTEFAGASRELLYGQIPRPITIWNEAERQALFSARNEYDEPISMLFHRVEWTLRDCEQALKNGKFRREKEVWYAGGIEQPIDIKQLLANLGTYAIHTGGWQGGLQDRMFLLVPSREKDFIELVQILYPHQAADSVARVLWKALIGKDELDQAIAGFLGPSPAMLNRLNLRYRKKNQNSLILRVPDECGAHEKAMEEISHRGEDQRAKSLLTGIMRLIDNHWDYEPNPAFEANDLIVLETVSNRTHKGLISFDGLKLHPKGRLLLAWVRNVRELELLIDRTAGQFAKLGRTPVLAFTTSRELYDKWISGTTQKLRDANSFLRLFQLSSAEEFLLLQIGLPHDDQKGFSLAPSQFTTPFFNRLQSLSRQWQEEIETWRKELDCMGRIAWPLRLGGQFRDEDREQLFKAWKSLLLDWPDAVSLSHLTCVPVQEVLTILGRMTVPQTAQAKGYSKEERAGLFTSLDEDAVPRIPEFLSFLYSRLQDGMQWTMELAEREWFWGYCFEGAKPQDLFQQWTELLKELKIALEKVDGGGRPSRKVEILSLERLKGFWKEADNWLKQKYPELVQTMAAIFGQGQVEELFSPPEAAKVGAKTLTAKDSLAKGLQMLSQLEILEGNLEKDRHGLLSESHVKQVVHLRTKIYSRIYQVYWKDGYEAITSSDGVKTLNFQEDREPLWKRIRLADLFALKVQKAIEIFQKRIPLLQDELRQEVTSLSGFPVNLFTRSFEKIKNILEGSTEDKPASGATQQTQMSQAGTLRSYLRDLNVARAVERLEKICREIGIDPETNREKPLSEIEGAIISGYTDMRKDFEDLRGKLDREKIRIQELGAFLMDAPPDFSISDAGCRPERLKKKAQEIEEELQESLPSDVEDLINRHDQNSRLGNFEPLMEESRKLFDSVKKSIGVFAGQVQTLENIVKGYIQKVYDQAQIQRIEKGFQILKSVSGSTPLPPFLKTQMEKSATLKAGCDQLETHKSRLFTEGNSLLANSQVEFKRWLNIVEMIDKGHDPQLSAQESNGLCDKGFLRRSYSFGMKQP